MTHAPNRPTPKPRELFAAPWQMALAWAGMIAAGTATLALLAWGIG